MLFAEKEISKNTAEYILYLWQVEDMLRALDLDINKVEQVLRSSSEIDEVMLRRELTRYQLMIADMRNEGIMESGHLRKTLEMMAELHQLHQNLLKKDAAYRVIFEKAAPNIEALMTRSGRNRLTEVEACFNGLYGLLILRLKKEPVTLETEEAMATFSKMLAYLSAKHRN